MITRHRTFWDAATGFFLTFAAERYTLKETGLKYHLGRVPMERRNGLPQNSGLDEQLWLASQNGDSEALRHLITRYDRLATSLCGSYCAAGMEREDLLQEAYLGLLKAIRSFQPEKGIPFSAFAGLCMKRQLISAVRRQNTGKNRLVSRFCFVGRIGNFQFTDRLAADWARSGGYFRRRVPRDAGAGHSAFISLRKRNAPALPERFQLRGNGEKAQMS